jgi:hypothetical protein
MRRPRSRPATCPDISWMTRPRVPVPKAPQEEDRFRCRLLPVASAPELTPYPSYGSRSRILASRETLETMSLASRTHASEAVHGAGFLEAAPHRRLTSPPPERLNHDRIRRRRATRQRLDRYPVQSADCPDGQRDRRGSARARAPRRRAPRRRRCGADKRPPDSLRRPLRRRGDPFRRRRGAALVEADAACRTAGDGGGAACARRRQALGARSARGICRPGHVHADSARHRVVFRRLGSGAERRHRWRRVRARPRLRLPVHGRRPVQHRATGNLPRIPARRRRYAAPNPVARRWQGPPDVP